MRTGWLAEAHALGIAHRDLDPGNLFLTQQRDGSRVVKIIDFGISRARGGDAHGERYSDEKHACSIWHNCC
jgi:serine/threonine-protein kinase